MKENSLWHSVSESEKEQIRKDSKELLQKFSKKLSNIKGVEEHFVSSVSKNGRRDNGEPWKTDKEFKEHFFSNAPFVENEFIVAEKGDWKK
jgi:predicted Asp-tRNA(Asn)/Glu-tRNA(Gln) amidotransferase subunit C